MLRNLAAVGIVCAWALMMSVGVTAQISPAPKSTPYLPAESAALQEHGVATSALGGATPQRGQKILDPQSWIRRGINSNQPSLVNVHPLPSFERSFTYEGKSYSIRVVGSDPRVHSDVTTVRALVVPLRLDFGNGEVSDASADTVLDQNRTALQTVVSSPIFQNADFKSGPVALGATQWGDAIMRAQFWDEAQHKPGYHLLLKLELAGVQSLMVPPEAVVSHASGPYYGLIDFSWMYQRLLVTLQALNPDPGAVVVFLLGPNWALTTDLSGDYIATGYHDAANLSGNPDDPVQTYMVAGFFSPGTTLHDSSPDVWTLSHEIAEWIDDPFLTSLVPPWTLIPYGCNQLAESGDYISANLSDGTVPTAIVPVTVGGTTYHLEDVVMLDWFTRAPRSEAANGWYSFNNTLTKVSEPCWDGYFEPPPFTFTQMMFPGARSTQFWGVNDAGDIVGIYRASNGSRHGLLYSNGVFQTLDVPGGVTTFPKGINNQGKIVGYYLDAIGIAHGFVYQSGQFTTVDYSLGVNTFLYSVNDLGDVAGGWASLDFTVDQSFIYKNGKFRNSTPSFAVRALAQGINNAGFTVGVFDAGNPNDNFAYAGVGQAFLPVQFPGVDLVSLNGIDDSGDLSGWFIDPLGVQSGFYRQDGQWHRVQLGYFTVLYDGNNRGTVVGFNNSYADNRQRGLILTKPR